MFSFIAQCSMVGVALHYCFIEPDMTKALLAVIAVGVFGIGVKLSK